MVDADKKTNGEEHTNGRKPQKGKSRFGGFLQSAHSRISVDGEIDWKKFFIGLGQVIAIIATTVAVLATAMARGCGQ